MLSVPFWRSELSAVVQSENASGCLHVCERSGSRYLSIVKLPRQYPVMGLWLIHRSDQLTHVQAAIYVLNRSNRLQQHEHHERARAYPKRVIPDSLVQAVADFATLKQAAGRAAHGCRRFHRIQRIQHFSYTDGNGTIRNQLYTEPAVYVGKLFQWFRIQALSTEPSVVGRHHRGYVHSFSASHSTQGCMWISIYTKYGVWVYPRDYLPSNNSFAA